MRLCPLVVGATWVLAAAALTQSFAQGVPDATAGGVTCVGNCPSSSGGAARSSSRSPSTPPALSPLDVAIDQARGAWDGAQWAEAEAAYLRALDLETRPAERAYILGMILKARIRLGRIDEAIAAGRTALASARSQTGVVHLDSGEMPIDEWARLNLVAALSKKLTQLKNAGRVDGARELHREAVAMKPGDPNLAEWGTWVDEMERKQSAASQAPARTQDAIDHLRRTSKAGAASAGGSLQFAPYAPPVAPAGAGSDGLATGTAGTGAGAASGLSFQGLESFGPGNPPADSVAAEADLRARLPGSLGTEAGATREARAQLPSAARLQTAVQRGDGDPPSQEALSRAAGEGFDTGGKDAGVLPTFALGARRNAEGDPIVSTERRHEVRDLERAREESKSLLAALQQEVRRIEQELRAAPVAATRGDLLLQRATLVQRESDTRNEIHFLNFSIEERLRKPPGPPASVDDGRQHEQRTP